MIRILLSARLGAMKMRQVELARMTGIRPNTISDLCNEMCERVSLEQLDLICSALHCDLTDLLKRTPPFAIVKYTRTGKRKENA